MSGGAGFEYLKRLHESLLKEEDLDAVPANKAKDLKKSWPKKPEEPYGDDHEVSTPKKDVKAKPDSPPSQAVPDDLKMRVTVDLMKSGLDGCYLQGPAYAFGRVAEILAIHGLEPTTEIDNETFIEDEGTLDVGVGWHNQDDPARPMPATGMKIKLSWTRQAADRYSIHATVGGSSDGAQEGSGPAV